jgi:peptidoglycan-N-acetylglucosamine deacetylase
MIVEIIIILAALIFLGYTLPFHTPIDSLYKDDLWRVRKDRCLHLTFDDGVNVEMTPYILDMLKSHHMTATFFLIPEHVHPQNAVVIKRMLHEGHTIGLHGKSRFLCWHTKRYLEQYIGGFEKMISTMVGKHYKVKYFRPPSGWRSHNLYKVLQKHGITLVGWSPFCWPDRFTHDGHTIAVRFGHHLKKGNIIVFHDGEASHDLQTRGDLRDALPEIFNELSAARIKSSKIKE